jgi:6-phosphogluconolactonase
MQPQQILYKIHDEMAQSLSRMITVRLQQAIDQNGQARLILPGGSSPQLLMKRLAQSDLDWSNVTIMPGDERCVPFDDPASNAGQIAALFSGAKVQPQLVRLWPDHPDDAVLSQISDVTVLGMGLDAHFASLFPGMGLEEGLIMKTRAPVAPHDRISLTTKKLLQTRSLVLLVNGSEKHEVARRILDGQMADTPLARLIRVAGSKLELHIVST